MLSLMKIKIAFVLFCSTLLAPCSKGEDLDSEISPASLACFESQIALKATSEPCESALNKTQVPSEQALILSNLAVIHAKLGLMSEAQITMAEALKLAPRNPSVYINLGNLRIRQKLFKEAIEALDIAAELGARQEASLYLNKSIAQRGLGKYFDAQENFIQYKLLTDQSGP